MTNVKKCSVEDCDCNSRALGLCRKHYERFHNHGTIEPTQSTNKGFCVICNEKLQRKMNMCSSCYSTFKYRTDPAYKAKKNECYARHRARKLGVLSEPYTREEVMKKTGGLCGICGKPIDLSLVLPKTDMFSFDHIIALANGGNDLLENIQPAHFGCNARKGSRY